MSRATGTDPVLLCEREVTALVMLDWDVCALLRSGGLEA